MKRIKNVKELKIGTKMVNIYDGKEDYYEFLMVHPHNDKYVLLLDDLTQNAKKFYIPNIEMSAYWQIDYTRKDLLNYLYNYYLEKADRMLDIIKNEE